MNFQTEPPADDFSTEAYSCNNLANGGKLCKSWCGNCLASVALVEHRAMMRERFIAKGVSAPSGASNPYRVFSDAAEWWQEGNDQSRTAPYYIGGPYLDGSYAVCEIDTGRVVQAINIKSSPPTNAAQFLLEALQSIVECCEEDRAARDYASRQTEIRGIARAAIKKAEAT